MAEIYLTRDLVSIIDDDDYPRVSQHRWYATPVANGKYYAARRNGPRSLGMARAILDAPAGLMVDHINGDTLDNRKHNLRLCSNRENQQNKSSKGTHSSRFKGVAYHRRDRRWQATIGVNGRSVFVGSFATEVDAALSYDLAARTHFGAFARCNYPDES